MKPTRMTIPPRPLQSISLKPSFAPMGSRKPKRKYGKCKTCGNPCRRDECFKCQNNKQD